MLVATSPSADVPLSLVELPSRPLGRDDIRIRVRAIGVNPVDWKMRAGGPLRMAHRFVGPSGPLVVGMDFAGEVIELGARAEGFAIGTRVVGNTDFSRKQLGSYATEVVVRGDQLAAIPDDMSFEVAASLPVPGATALVSLLDLGRIDRRENARVLVIGASGGVGLASIQLARMHGARVVGICSARNVAVVERMGATAIDYGKGDALEAARAHGPFDVIVNAVGTANYPLAVSRSLLRKGGKLALVVQRGADVPTIAVCPDVASVLGRARRPRLEALIDAVGKGALETIIEDRFPLSRAEEAHVRSRAGKVVGKLVIVPDA
jgi:NADPH:quinone reductase-like Zn-dependent oxidoreductase